VVRHFPKTHVAALAGASALIGLVLALSPGSGAEAQRVSAYLDLDTGQLQPAVTIPEDLQADDNKDAASRQANAITEEYLRKAARIAAAAPSRERMEALAESPEPVDSSFAEADIEPQAPEPKLTHKSFKVQSGDTLSRIFSRAGLNDRAMYAVLNGAGSGDQLSRLRQGQEIEFLLTEEGELQQLTLHHSRTKKLEAHLGEDGYTTSEVYRDPDVVLAYASGKIESSFALSAQRAGLNGRLTNNLANIFGWQINFGRDLRKGDRFSVLYEKHYVDGEKVGYGRIMSAQFHNRGEEYTAVLFTDDEGHAEYFAPDGSSMRKAFMREPLEYNRISSSFNLNRRHPILNRVRPHEGTDFAAATGTPVRAAGDGRVTYASRDGGYGKTIRIQHGNNVQTVYAHLHSYASGMRAGKRVRQGEIIGTVGMTGLATGPHLHYEYRVNGQPRNPMRVALPDADPIPQNQMEAFRNQAKPLMAQLATRDESFQVAMADE